MQNNSWTEQLHLKNIIKSHHTVMNVGLAAIVANGQETLSIDNYDIK